MVRCSHVNEEDEDDVDSKEEDFEQNSVVLSRRFYMLWIESDLSVLINVDCSSHDVNV